MSLRQQLAGFVSALPNLRSRYGELFPGQLVGSVNTNVLYFDPSDVREAIGDGIDAVHSATLGSSWTINKRGIYNAVLGCIVSDTGAGSVVFAISKNATVLVGAPANALDPGILLSSRTLTALNSNDGIVSLSVTFSVSAAEAAAGAVIRAHGTTIAGAAPSIANGSDCFVLQRLADYPA